METVGCDLFIASHLFSLCCLFLRISSSCSTKAWRWWSSSIGPPSMSTCSFSCSTRNFTGNRKRKDKRATDTDLNHKTHFEGCRKPRPEPSWLRYTFPAALLSCAYANFCALFFIMWITICALFLMEHSIVRLEPARHRSLLESFSYRLYCL